MGREEQLSEIFLQFDRSAQQFCEETQGLFCALSDQYKGGKNPENLKYRFAKVYYGSFAVKFVYTAHGVMSTVNSILGCTVYPDKNEENIGIPLPLLTDYCGMDVAAPLCIPLITNPAGMVQAFGCIGGVLKELLPVLAEISRDAKGKEAIFRAFFDEMRDVFGVSEEQEMLRNTEFIQNFLTLRFCGDAFINFLKGNKTKAVKQLGRIKKKTGYEKRLQAIWMSEDHTDLAVLSEIILNTDFYNDNGVQKTSFGEFAAVFLSWLLLTPVIGAVYVGLYFLFVRIEGRNSVYLMGPIYNFPYAILFGFLAAIAASYFARFRIYKLLNKKKYKKYREMDYIQNGGGADRLMKGVLVACVTVGIVGCAILAKWNLNFLADGFVDNSKFLSVQGAYYPYSEVERVYYKPNRVNSFNETLDFPSYVIVLKDGAEIDLYDHGDISDYEQTLLKYLKEKGVKIEDQVS